MGQSGQFNNAQVQAQSQGIRVGGAAASPSPSSRPPPPLFSANTPSNGPTQDIPAGTRQNTVTGGSGHGHNPGQVQPQPQSQSRQSSGPLSTFPSQPHAYVEIDPEQSDSDFQMYTANPNNHIRPDTLKPDMPVFPDLGDVSEFKKRWGDMPPAKYAHGVSDPKVTCALKMIVDNRGNTSFIDGGIMLRVSIIEGKRSTGEWRRGR